MASVRNSARSKRKYGDKRTSATAKNKASKTASAELHELRKQDRTKALVGKQVEVRTKEFGKITEFVTEIRSAPEGSLRKNGQFVVVVHQYQEIVRSRHRVKVVA